MFTRNSRVLLILSTFSSTLLANNICTDEYGAIWRSPVPTRKNNVVIADPYRWLEADTAERKAWIAAQKDVAQRYLAQNKNRPFWDSFLKKLWDKEHTVIQRKGKDYSISLVDRGLAKPTDVVIDDLATKEKKTILSTFDFAKNGTMAFFNINTSPTWEHAVIFGAERGTLDDHVLVVVAPKSGKVLEKLDYVHAQNVYWISQDEFLYARGIGPVDRIFKHKVGTPQVSDTMYGPAGEIDLHIMQTPDKKWFAHSNLQSKDKIFLQNTTTKQSFSINRNFDSLLGSSGNSIFVEQSGKKSRNQIAVITLRDDGKSSIKTLVAETDMLLTQATFKNDHLQLFYGMGKKQKVAAHDLSGKKIFEVDVPEAASPNSIKFNETKDKVTINLSTPVHGSVDLTYDIKAGRFIEDNIEDLLLKKDGQEYVVEYLDATSKDGTKIPVRVSYKKGLAKNGANPSFIEGYGGFNVEAYFYPYFNDITLQFLNDGGVHIAPALRGGNEGGPAWHKSGRLLLKQNVFNDLIASTELVQKLGYTSPQKTGVMGGSNGGLLVGATINQRPDLFKVAIPVNGVQDMFRRDIFDLRFDYGWSYEYGQLSDPELVQYLQTYSPVHTAKPAKYPTTLVMVGMDDSRVLPTHSYKLTATLQEHQRGPNPILLIPTENAGHWVTKESRQDLIAWRRTSDLWSSIYRELGIEKTAE